MCYRCGKNCMKRKSWAEWTKYPKLFESVYWGNFSSCEFEDGSFDNKPDEQIIQNRNEFISTYHIKKMGKPKKTIDNFIHINFLDRNKFNFIDHIEYYKTDDNKIIIISSPYSLTDEDIQKCEKKGWVQIKNIFIRKIQ